MLFLTKNVWRFRIATVLFIGVLGLSGCGQNEKMVKVTGKVTLNKQPVTSGSVSFVGEPFAGNAPIKPDGTYELLEAPVGKELAISVRTAPGGPGPKSGPVAPKGVDLTGMMAPEAKGKGVRIPMKYSDPKASGLKYTPTSDSVNTHDIDLVP